MATEQAIKQWMRIILPMYLISQETYRKQNFLKYMMIIKEKIKYLVINQYQMPYPKFPQLPKIVRPIKGFKHLPTPPKLTSLQKITHKVVVAKKQWKIFTGDLVQVIAGPDKGKQGKVRRVYRKLNQILIEGVNQQQNPYKAIQSLQQGIEPMLFDNPIWYGQVNLVDPSNNKPTQVYLGYLEDGTQVRVSKSTGVVIPKPSFDHMKYENRHLDKVDGVMDTLSQKVFEVTYQGEDFEGIKKEFLENIQKKEEMEKNLVFDA